MVATKVTTTVTTKVTTTGEALSETGRFAESPRGLLR